MPSSLQELPQVTHYMCSTTAVCFPLAVRQAHGMNSSGVQCTVVQSRSYRQDGRERSLVCGTCGVVVRRYYSDTWRHGAHH